MQTATKTAAAPESMDESYFWRDNNTLLFLRRAPGETVFRAVLVDALTGKETVPQAFNDRNSPLMESSRMLVSYAGSLESEMHYLPPTAAMSSDGKWLLWSNTASRARRQWVAATFEGQQQAWAQGIDPYNSTTDIGGHAFWMPDSERWVELVNRYKNCVYSIHYANVYEPGKPAPIRTVRIRGLRDGLPVGIRQDGTVVMHTSFYERGKPVQQIDLSLVSVEADTATARKLSVPIPISNRVSDVKLSPRGDRLAWILEQERSGKRLYTVYIADADGAHVRPVGSVEGITSGTGYTWARDLQWLPDGKQVSFVYKRAIYTHPV